MFKTLMKELILIYTNEKFLKKLILLLLNWLVQKTATTKDDELLQLIKEAWEDK